MPANTAPAADGAQQRQQPIEPEQPGNSPHHAPLRTVQPAIFQLPGEPAGNRRVQPGGMQNQPLLRAEQGIRSAATEGSELPRGLPAGAGHHGNGAARGGAKSRVQQPLRDGS